MPPFPPIILATSVGPCRADRTSDGWDFVSLETGQRVASVNARLGTAASDPRLDPWAMRDDAEAIAADRD